MTVLKRIVCLANSKKKGGLCVAGKEITDGGITDWIRPVSERPDEEVMPSECRYEDGSDLRVMDIVDVPVIGHRPNDFQSENWLLDPSHRWVNMGQLDWDELEQLIDSIEPLWHNGDRSYFGLNNRMQPGIANTISNSLRFLWVDALTILVNAPGGRRRVDGRFQYDNTVYQLSVTDPHYEQTYKAQPVGNYNIGGCFLSVSVGELYNGHHYKLIAAIIRREDHS